MSGAGCVRSFFLGEVLKPGVLLHVGKRDCRGHSGETGLCACAAYSPRAPLYKKQQPAGGVGWCTHNVAAACSVRNGPRSSAVYIYHISRAPHSEKIPEEMSRTRSTESQS